MSSVRSNQNLDICVKTVPFFVTSLFRITSKQGEQILATKTRKKDGNIQFEITKEYLLDFIKKNEELSDMLYKYRGY